MSNLVYSLHIASGSKGFRRRVRKVLIIDMGQNCLKTLLISRYQGTWLLLVMRA
jgi:hypothetical protein